MDSSQISLFIKSKMYKNYKTVIDKGFSHIHTSYRPENKGHKLEGKDLKVQMQ